MKQRVLVTGATGFIGRALLTHLLAQTDITPVLLLREPYSDPRLLPPFLAAIRTQYEAVYADLRNFQLTVRAVREAEPEAVIHLAAAGATDPFLSVQTAVSHNLTGTVNLARACFEKNFTVRRLLVARTPGEQSAMNSYAASKAAAWQFCQMYGRTQNWPIHGAMIFQAYGPHQPEHTLIPAASKAALAGQDFPLTQGSQIKDWIYVTDVVAGLLAALDAELSPGTTVELGSGQGAAVAAVVTQIYELVQQHGWATQAGRPLIGALPARPGEVPQQIADAASTKELLGWETAVSLNNGLQQYLQTLRHT
ncbi:MAG: NAD(P)-dependent oxidoreductase [Ardenticatenaceae bacterium]|nr:NAD(P)-dependent oxidoreductase [Ardenticatenaceae bacterium]